MDQLYGYYTDLQITMYDSLVMHIVDSLKYLPYQVRCIFLGVRTFFDNSVKQFATGYSLQKRKERKKKIMTKIQIGTQPLSDYTQFMVKFNSKYLAYNSMTR